MDNATFLATFANQLSSPTLIAGLVQPDRCRFSWIAPPPELLDPVQRTTGASGACLISPEVAAICTQEPNPFVFLLHLPTRRTCNARRLRLTVDPHSVLFRNDSLFLVSTGTNSIIRLPWRDAEFGEEESYWQYPNVSASINEVHLNGITFFEETFIASCFGGSRQNGNGTRNGKVFFIDTGEAIAEHLNQPHSPVFTGEKLVVAESGTGKVLIFAKGKARDFHFVAEISTGGYPRGLAHSGEYLYVGISSTRNISKSQQRMLKRPDTSNITSIVRIKLADLSLDASFPMHALAREIYEIVPVAAPASLDSWSEASRLRLVAMEENWEKIFENYRDASENVQRLEEAVRCLRASLSWKVTAPLRWLAGKIGFHNNGDR